MGGWEEDSGGVMSPLPALGTMLLLWGGVWAGIEICRVCPWLVPLSAGLGCFALHGLLLLRRHGLSAWFPSLEQSLERPAFELLCEGLQEYAPQGCHIARLLVLAGVELDEQQRTQMLSELSPEYRKKVFYRPAARLLPQWVQALILGSDRSSDDDSSTQVSSPMVSPRRSVSAPAVTTPRVDMDGQELARQHSPGSSSASKPSTTVEEVMEAIRKVERGSSTPWWGKQNIPPAPKKLAETSLIKIANQKMADVTVGASPDWIWSTLRSLAGVAGTSAFSVATLPWRVARDLSLMPLEWARDVAATAAPMKWQRLEDVLRNGGSLTEIRFAAREAVQEFWEQVSSKREPLTALSVPPPQDSRSACPVTVPPIALGQMKRD